VEYTLKEVNFCSQTATIEGHQRFLNSLDATKKASFFISLSRMLSFSGSLTRPYGCVYDRKLMQLVRAPRVKSMSPDEQKQFMSMAAFDADIFGQQLAGKAHPADRQMWYYFFPTRLEYMSILIKTSDIGDSGGTFFRLANDVLSEFSSLPSVRGRFAI
jgi:hypothetical protein